MSGLDHHVGRSMWKRKCPCPCVMIRRELVGSMNLTAIDHHDDLCSACAKAGHYLMM